MNPATLCFAIISSAMIIGLIFFVILGQITVRKLRKNIAMKDALGMAFMSGWDIANVMSALALPRKTTRRFKNSPLAALEADADLLDKYTTRFDRILARIAFSLMASSALALIIFFFLDEIGVFE